MVSTDISNETTESFKTTISCKFCKKDVDLLQMRQLPKKLIMEKNGLLWTGLEKVFLIIYKVQCQACKKKYSYKRFASEFLYK
jgi:hypothetical protein